MGQVFPQVPATSSLSVFSLFPLSVHLCMSVFPTISPQRGVSQPLGSRRHEYFIAFCSRKQARQGRRPPQQVGRRKTGRVEGGRIRGESQGRQIWGLVQASGKPSPPWFPWRVAPERLGRRGSNTFQGPTIPGNARA